MTISKQARAFDQYMGLGPSRSLHDLHELLKRCHATFGLKRPPSLRTIETWSVRFGWQRQIADLERKEREEAERELLDALRQHRERQRRDALFLQDRGREWLREKTGADVTAAEALRAVDAGYRLEALALGQPSDRLAMEVSDDRFERLTDDELELVIKLARESKPPGT